MPFKLKDKVLSVGEVDFTGTGIIKQISQHSTFPYWVEYGGPGEGVWCREADLKYPEAFYHYQLATRGFITAPENLNEEELKSLVMSTILPNLKDLLRVQLVVDS